MFGISNGEHYVQVRHTDTAVVVTFGDNPYLWEHMHEASGFMKNLIAQQPVLEEVLGIEIFC